MRRIVTCIIFPTSSNFPPFPLHGRYLESMRADMLRLDELERQRQQQEQQQRVMRMHHTMHSQQLTHELQAAAELAARAAEEERQKLHAEAAKVAQFDSDVAAAAARFAAAAPPPPGPGTVNIAVKLPSGKRPTRRWACCQGLLKGLWVYIAGV